MLPSGKVVDQSTIDRHSEVEAKWGRLPSDPFTGLEFTSQRKAILNLSLKARIEKFLMENSEQFKTVPRSLGSSRVRRSKNRHASQFASLCQSHSTVSGTYSRLSGSAASATYATASEMLSSTPIQHISKRPKLDDSYRGSTIPFATLSTATQTTATASFNLGKVTAAATASSMSSTASVSSIDRDIQKALEKITRFTCPPPETTDAVCISCKSEDFAYEIATCNHLVCRQCLVHLTREQMCICKTSFRGADVERYHKF